MFFFSQPNNLHRAAKAGDVNAVTQLLQDPTVDVNAKENYGWTAAHFAARNDNAAVMELLAAKGADLDAKDKDGQTPAHVAVASCKAASIEVLVSHGADLEAKDNSGKTAAHLAATHDSAAMMELLAAKGADLNAKSNGGWTPAHFAACNLSTAVMEVLASARADFNAKNKDGKTPAHIAASYRAVVMEVLVSNGADVNVEDNSGWTPAHLAARKDSTAMMEVLIASADVHSKNKDGQTLAHYAARNGNAAVLEMLVSKGADLNAKDNDGETPAHHAAVTASFSPMGELLSSRIPQQLRDTQCELKAAAAESAGLKAQLKDAQTQLCDTGRRLDAATCRLEETEGAADASLSALLEDVIAVMSGPDGWSAPHMDLAAAALRVVEQFGHSREALATALAEAAETTNADPARAAHLRAECCAAATALLADLPPAADGSPVGIPAAPPRPPPAMIGELADAAAAADRTRRAAFATMADVAGTEAPNRVAATVQAAVAVNTACASHIDVVRAKFDAARAAAAAAPGPSLSAEECGRLREAAEAVLEFGPWAGDEGLRRREAALTGVRDLVERRAAAQKQLKREKKRLTAAKGNLDVHSDSDDEDDVKSAHEALRAAEAEHAAALPNALAATAALQKWATSGEGARALKAFPGDVELTAALTGLFEADFTAETALPQTPAVALDDEYPAGLAQAPATHVYFAARVVGGASVPVVLRRLRLDSAELVQEAQRQLHDAGRIAVGLQGCPDAAAGFPAVVKATRWFLATAPGSRSPDAWLEFPRAPFGSLAEALAMAEVAFTAAGGVGLCLRLARAVAQLHAAGIRHGDLNPSNVVLWDDPSSDVVRPGIIDLLDTAVVGATRTLRGATLAWLAPEATAAVAAGAKAYGTRQLDCWQLGRVCEAILDASAALPDQLLPVRAAAAALCVDDPGARSTAAAAFLAMDAAAAAAAVAGGAALSAHAGLQWALPPALWECQRGAARGVEFVELCQATDPAGVALTACATDVGRTVRTIYRLENVQLWHVFAAERARVAEVAQGAVGPQQLVSEAAQTFAAAPDDRASLAQEPPVAGEALLLHGAPERSLRLIAEGGLDPSYSGGRVGALFGAATCLTPSWVKASDYARGAGAGVFVTRAAVGIVADCQQTPRRETSQYRRPPDGHHSVLGDNGSPGAVVAMYRPSRMYPEYLVVFDD